MSPAETTPSCANTAPTAYLSKMIPPVKHWVLATYTWERQMASMIKGVRNIEQIAVAGKV